MEKGVCNLVQKYSPQLIARRAMNSPASLFRIGVSRNAIVCVHACWAKHSSTRAWGPLMPCAARPVHVLCLLRSTVTTAQPLPAAGLVSISTFLLRSLLLLMTWMLRRVQDTLLSCLSGRHEGSLIQPHQGLLPAAGSWG